MTKNVFTTLSIFACCLVGVAVFALTGCGGGSSPDAVGDKRDPEPAKPTEVVKNDEKKADKKSTGGGKAYDPAAATCTVKGVVTFDGKPKTMTLIPISEQQCAMHHGDKGLKKEDLVVNADGKVANVVIYVSEGYKDWNFENYTLPNAKFNQLGCQYIPHVLAMKVDQKLDIQSSDPVPHNVHGSSKESPEFNISQPTPGILPQHPSYSSPELGAAVKCDVHGWMNAWVCVFEHPFFAVTKEDGTYEFKLPPGKYTISSWQELQPTKKVLASAPIQIEVTAEKNTAEANFVYKNKP